ncbi:MAG TPA: DNA repair protein RadC [Candidatus Saccharimonadales bacterium]|jgi:DNA repair protein RadC
MPARRKIHQLPLADRPREKLQRKGPPALSDFELLEVLIGNGTSGADVGSIARRVQKLMQKGAAGLNYESLTTIKGVSLATASKILASLELAKRHLVRDIEPLRTQQDILARLGDIRTRQQEYFICLSLDGGQRLIAQRTITIGTLDTVLAHPREVFADAIADRAASVIVAHNHPSGDVAPSQKDVALTQQLAAAGQLLGIPLRDHLILTKTEHFSYRQHHLL